MRKIFNLINNDYIMRKLFNVLNGGITRLHCTDFHCTVNYFALIFTPTRGYNFPHKEYNKTNLQNTRIAISENAKLSFCKY